MQTSDMELIRDFLTEEEIFRKFQAWLEEKPREIESTEAESILCLLEDHIAAQKEFLNFHIK